MIFVLVRTIVYSMVFMGVVLYFLPAAVLAAAGIRAPASFGAWQVAGLAIGLPGFGLAIACIASFAFVGRGTPAPFDPPRRLVVRGPYRLVRNPMYLGAALYLAGFAIFYQSTGGALYALAFLAVVHAFVVFYEEPALRRTFGCDYEAYCERVGRWWPSVMRPSLLCIVVCLLSASPLEAAERWRIGLTAASQPIDALVVAGPSSSAPTVLVIGGLGGRDESVDVVSQEAAAFERQPQARRRFRLIAVPLANPDGRPLQFPPSGTAYKENAESHVLWRWIGVHAPDLAIVVRESAGGLADALSQSAVAFVGKIPSRVVAAKPGILRSLTAPIPLSEAHLEIVRRLKRSPREVAEQLGTVYGHEFDQPTYISAMALIAQLRLGNMAEVLQLADRYLDGSADSFARPSQSSLAAHVLFYEIASRTGDKRATRLVIRAANSGFTVGEALREFMPLNGGWSDSVFMDIPILAKAGALTGDRKYFDMAARHFSYMQKIVRRPDGLYRHQASTDAAWGRGNGFPALGLALTLTNFPANHPEYPALLEAFQTHMKALSRYQDENGMFREVIDYPGAYPEYSGTTMIATAMMRGIRKGWLDRSAYQPIVDRAWQAILMRTALDGRLFDVAESTGTRGLTLEDYLRRAAILDRDPRGGAFAMILATEIAGLGVDF
jgi:unsaturated rhamnogalacturonyl hydrolase